jgi:DNA-binding HxlR family transcriptional regulator
MNYLFIRADAVMHGKQSSRIVFLLYRDKAWIIGSPVRALVVVLKKTALGYSPVDAMMRVMDGRWKGTILWRLQDGPRRTSELKRGIPGITERMLIRHLQELVADGIVKRDDKKTIPPCVYYSLSSYGRTLGPVVQMMCDWGRSHLKRLSAKR